MYNTLRATHNKTINLEIHYYVVFEIILIDYYVDVMHNFINLFIIEVTITYKFIFKYFNILSFGIEV